MAKQSKSKQDTPQQSLVPGTFSTIIDPVRNEFVETVADVPVITAFLKKLATFYETAKTIEVAAKEREARALTVPVPKTAEEDEHLQLAIKAVNIEKKAVQTHWEITALISRVHRRMTGRRKVAEDALEAASVHLNKQHNTFVDDQKRIARERQEQLQREENERAARERQAELDRIEAEAAALEVESPELSAREVVFVNAYVLKQNAAQAAADAGYKNPSTKGPQLLTYTKILEAITAAQQAFALREQAKAVEAAPVRAEKIEVKPAVTRAVGAVSRTTWAADLFDEPALIAAVLDSWKRQELGIPTDILQIDRVKLNEYARSLQRNLDRWPGVVAKPTTKVV